MRKQVGLKDIANKVGVSATLVSYVLNNKFTDRINKDTADRIRKAAKELRYQTNQIAKSLKSNKTQTIGLVVADISNPFSGSIARIIEDEAKKNNFTLLFASADEDCKKAEDVIELLLNRQVDGLIIAPPDGFEENLLSLKEREVPFVLIDRYYPNQDFKYIATNNFQVSYQAVSHLISNGFKSIGLLNYDTNLFHMNERMRGYTSAIENAGLEVDESNIIKINEERMVVDIENSMNKLMSKSNPIDAIFFSSNNIAVEGLKYVSNKKIRTPQDLGIVCFDFIDAYGLFYTTLTYIKQPLIEMGQCAVKSLMELIENLPQSEIEEFKSELVVQQSSTR